VLGAACYLEGVLEALLRAILRCRKGQFDEYLDFVNGEARWAMGKYYTRIEEDVSRRIGRAVGAAGYDEMFELLVGRRLSQMNEVSPFWEAVNVLFNFRNVLGHGREVSARHFTGGAVPGGVREDFPGSYKLVEDYLRKKSLLNQRFVDAHSEYLFLSEAIADHFWAVASGIPTAVMASLPEDERKACRDAFEATLENVTQTGNALDA
jgi:hypothetical protein